MKNEQWINDFRERILAFDEKLQDFNAGKIDRKEYKGFSGGFGSYAQRDPSKNMLRLRLPGGRLTVKQLGFLARTVERYQIDLMKLTTCETIQLHNLTQDQVAQIMEQAIDYGIYTLGGGGDNPRNVMCSPLSGVQQGEAFDVLPYAEAATRYLLSVSGKIKMPRKLKVAFSNGVDDSVHATFRDMGFLANPDGAFDLYIAGGLGSNHKMGILAQKWIAADEILAYIKAMILTFCEHGNYENRAKARTRYMQETLGEEGLRNAFLENVKKVKEDGVPELEISDIVVDKQGSGEISGKRIVAQKQSGLFAVSYHPIGGCLPVEKPAQLESLLQGIPAAECRIAPDGTMYIVNLTADEAATILEATNDSALNEFENSVSCIGAAICQQGVRDSQSTLKMLVDEVRKQKFKDGTLPRIRISGCPSSCGAHQVAAIGFQGCVKPVDKKPMPAYRLTVNGTDALYKEAFGEFLGIVLEQDMSALLTEFGKAVESDGSTWKEWAPLHLAEIRAIAEKYCK